MASHYPHVTIEDYLRLSPNYGPLHNTHGVTYGQPKLQEDIERCVTWEFAWRDPTTLFDMYAYPILTLSRHVGEGELNDMVATVKDQILGFNRSWNKTIAGATGCDVVIPDTDQVIRTIFFVTTLPPIADLAVYDTLIADFRVQATHAMRYIVPHFFNDITSGKVGLNYLDLGYTTKKVMQYMSEFK